MAQITTIVALKALFGGAVPAALLSLMVTPLILDTPNMPNQECGDRSEISTPLIPQSPIMMNN